jgi:hypothetical protein
METMQDVHGIRVPGALNTIQYWERHSTRASPGEDQIQKFSTCQKLSSRLPLDGPGDGTHCFFGKNFPTPTRT